MRMTFVFMAFVLICSALWAGRVLDIGLYLCKNDTVALADLSVSPGEPSRFTPEDGNYTFVLLDEQGRTLSQMGVDPLFYILSDPPQETECIAVGDNIQYYPTARFFAARHLGKEIFRYEFPANMTCNRNGYCDANENAVGCPKDCKVTGDSVCQPFDDNACDIACPTGADPDCRPRPPKPPENGPALVICLAGIGALALAAVAILAAWIFLRRKKEAAKAAGPAKPHAVAQRKSRRKEKE